MTTICKVPADAVPDKGMVGFGYVRGDASTAGQLCVENDGSVTAWCNKASSGYFAGFVAYSV